jgi:myo-inositol-1(or 4)-monophosphatase
MGRLNPSAVDAILGAVATCGDLLVRRQRSTSGEYKEDQTIVTAADKIVAESLVAVLRSSVPGIRLLVEDCEGEELPDAKSDFLAVVDPLDGTGPYVRGFQHYAISVCVFREGERLVPLLAVVHMPGMQRWCIARSDLDGVNLWTGSSLDGMKLQSKKVFEPDWQSGRAYIWASSDAHRFLGKYPGKIRAFGASALHLAMLTDGTYDPAAVLLSRYKFHDVAAGLVLAEAAGFGIRDVRSGRPLSIKYLLTNASAPPPIVVASPSSVEHLVTQFWE